VKIWITKNSEVTVHEQIVTQVRVGITSGDLKPGDRIPSAREIARRFGIHANTVTAAYRELAASGDIDLRRGSGTFVAEAGSERSVGKASLDAMVAELGAMLVRSGHSRRDVAAAFSRWAESSGGAIHLIEPNDGLFRLLAFEIANALGCSVERCGPDEVASLLAAGKFVAALPDELAKLNGEIASEKRVQVLRANSIPQALSGHPKPSSEELIGVVSEWDDFASFARVYLAAAGIDIEALVVRSSADAEWKRDISLCSIVICDSVAGAMLGNDERKRVFTLISVQTLEELRGFLKDLGPDDQPLPGRE